MKIKIPFYLELAGISLLFIPKVNIVQFKGETAGLRIDDVLLALIGAWIGIFSFANLRYRVKAIEVRIFIFTLFSFFAWLCNGGSIFYVVRTCEYFIFFYIGIEAVKLFKLKTLIMSLLSVNAIVMVLQSLSLIGGFTVYGWWEDVGYRVVGLTAGPWEIGLLINLCLCALLFPLQNFITKKTALLLFILGAYLLLLAGGRMPLIAHGIIFLCYLLRYFYKRVLSSSILIGLGVCAAMFLLSSNDLVVERSRSTFNWENINALTNAYAALDVTDPERLDMSSYFSGQTDPSWIIRVSKWCFAIKYFVASGPLAWLFGTGPGRYGSALDGGFLRLLTEHGVLGLIVFCSVLHLFARQNAMMLMCVVAFAINLIFLDVHITYKVMALLFFLYGYSLQWSSLEARRKELGGPEWKPEELRSNALTASGEK